MEIEIFKSNVKDWLDILKPSTAKPYLQGVYRYCEYFKLTPKQIVEEARQDYVDRCPPWEVRSTKHVKDFVQYLKKDKSISNMSKLTYIAGIRKFYKFHEVPLAEIEIDITAELTEKYKEIKLLSLDDIRKAVLACGHGERMIKALILTFLSSGQAQAEIQKLRGKHLKNIVNNVAIIKTTRGKTNTNYIFFIGKEALDAIYQYKPAIGDEEFVFTLWSDNTKPLDDIYIDTIFNRFAEKLEFPKKYFNPHRFRHYYKSILTGKMTDLYIEYTMGHKLIGVQSSYFDGVGRQNEMLEEYIKNQKYITVFTEQEVLQKQYDELKSKSGDLLSVKEENQKLKSQMEELQKEQIEFYKKIEKIMKEKYSDEYTQKQVEKDAAYTE